MKYTLLAGLALLLTGISCNTSKNDYDASGNFEADEVIVSAEQNGVLLSFTINEGDRVNEGATVGRIDVVIPTLQKEQAQASIEALRNKTSSAEEQNDLEKRQLIVEEAQLAQLIKEQARTENLVKADAATRKQLDDITAQADQLQKQIAVTRQQLKVNVSNTNTQNKSILSEKKPLEKMVAQYQELEKRGQVVNPITGTVLAKYALKGEMAMVGKPLYKIANTDTLTLKAYVTADNLSQIKTGQQVTVRIDQGKKGYKNYTGMIYWVSPKSEFTPKTIQTKDERASLVYAVKVRVKNDGFLRIGMYGELVWNQPG
ncbi:MAG: HlyD family efflux transporter periplasmic adaptor subunit [Chitinophagaceae bacterium]